MELRCPYCAFVIVAKGVRAGNFSPRCPKCQKKFALFVPQGEGALPIVKAMKQPDAVRAADGSVTAAPGPAATAIPVAAAA